MFDTVGQVGKLSKNNENGPCNTTLLSHVELSYIFYKGGQNVPNFKECPMFQKQLVIWANQSGSFNLPHPKTNFGCTRQLINTRNKYG
jgi:hypothetical protein